ncbi:hypothetical protein ONE63_004153 [Megalurothrips usitatus]|uniref:Uncharacterized protein n=1 Tax=Megalurothrips usitatus TaxID=439358 RepID=A0AAV7X8T6_9NEOP|nr:hypothetical protein ONE63_004153 [Megalurothrips usitatus]
MIFDAVKRFLGIGDGQTRHVDESRPSQLPGDDRRLDLYGRQSSPDIREIESDLAQVHKFMEEQMRFMMGSFGFSFGSPGFGFEDDSNGFFRSLPFSRPHFPHSPDIPSGPQPALPSTPLDPREEMLKPQYRTKPSGQWSGQDQVLDDRVNSEGLGSIIEDLRPPTQVYEGNNPFENFSPFFGSGPFRNGLFGGIPNPGSFSSSSTVTIYSNVNGHSSMEKIVTHPDGRIERTVITNDGNTEQ